MSSLSCPKHDVLRACFTGELAESDAEDVLDHVSACSVCQAELQTIAVRDDTLAARLRAPVTDDPYLKEDEYAALVAKAKALGGSVPPVGESGAAADDVFPGQGSLGEYELLEKLGAGGMGAVYKARHKHLERFVALKVLSADRARDAQAVSRFYREMKAVGRVDHPNVVRATDAREIDGKPVLVMEYIAGMDLNAICKRAGRLTAADACEVIRQAALGLQAAHENGLVHRDVKPSNLMLTPNGQVKLLDLGLARLAADASPTPAAAEFTGAGMAMGTADYVAPEQVSDARGVDIRADIYSLGCTLYKLLTGQAPFAGAAYRSAFDKMMGHVRDRARPITELRPDLPPPLAAAIERMMAKDRAGRHALPQEVADALTQFAAEADLVRLYREVAGGTACAEEADAALRSSPAQPARRDASAQPGTRRGWRGIVAAALTLVGVAALGSWGIVLTVRDDKGRETTVELPPGSTATVGADGKIAVQLPTGQPKTAFSATADRGPNLAGLPAQEDPWPGLAARPAQIPGLGRWQIETAAVRSQARALQFTPDGKRLVVGDGSRIRVYDVPSFKLQRVLLGHTGPITSLAIHPAGNLVAAGTCWSPEVRVWDLTTGIQKATTEKTTQFDHDVFGLAWSPDGTQLAVCAKIWNQTPRGSLHLLVAQLANRQVLDKDLDFRRLCWSPDGKWIAAAKTVGEESEVHLWEPEGKAGPVLPVAGKIECISFTSDGRFLAASGDLSRTESAVLTWDSQTWTPKTVSLGIPPGRCDGSPPGSVGAFACGPQGGQLALLADHAVWLFDVVSGKAAWLEGHHFAGSIAFSNTGDWIAHGGAGADVCTWNVKTGSRGPTLGYERSYQYTESRACASGQVVALSSEDERGDIRLWKPDGRPEATLRGHTSPVLTMGFSADGQHLASASHEPIIRLWCKDGQAGVWKAADVATLAGHADEVLAVAWNRDGTRLVSGARDGKVGVWDVATGRLRFPLLSQAGPINKVAWSATGKHFASLCPADKEHPIRVWSAEGQAVRTPDARPDTNGMCWSPEGDILAIWGDESPVRFWSLAEQKAIVELAGPSRVWHLAWSPDGQRVATDEGGIRLWHRDGTPDMFVEGGRGRHLFSPDSRQLAEWELVIGVTDKTTRRFSSGPANLGFDPLVWSSDSRHLLAIDLATLTCWDTETMTVASNSLILPAGQGARITADGTLETTGPQAEQEIIYIVEGPGGQQKVYSPAEFRKLVADLPTSSSPGSNAAATGSP